MAISGLNKQEAITLLQRQGLSTAQQAQVLSSAGLLQTTQMLNASLVEEAVLNSKISGEKAEQILTELGLIEAKTGNLIVTKECTVAEVAQALATKGIVGADAEAILSQLGLATANTTTTASFAGLTTAIKANTAAMAKWLVTNPVGWCILAVGAIYGLSKAYDALTVSEEEMAKAHEESVQKAKDSISEYEELKQELETIQQTYDDNEQKLKDLYKLRENQTITQAEQDYLEELEGQNEKLRQQIEYKQTLADIDAKEAEDDAVTALNEKTQNDSFTGHSTNGGATVEFDKITDADKIKQNTATINALTDDLTAYEKVIQGISLSQEEVDKYTQQLVGYQEQLNSVEGDSDSANSQRDFYQGKIDELQRLLDGTLTYEEYEKAISDATSSVQSLVSENDTLLQKVEPLNDAIKSTTGENYELKKANDEIIANAKDAAIGFNEYTDSLNGTADALNNVQNSTSANKIDFSSQISSFTTAQEALNTALSEQNETGRISSETLATLRDNFEGINDVVEETTNGIIINTDKLANLNKAEREKIETGLALKEEELVEQFNNASLQLATYESIMKNTTSTDENYLETLRNTINATKEQKDAISEQIGELNLLQLEYENSISKHNRFIEALSTKDAGSGYDDVTSGLEQVEKEWNAGNVGKDEIRNFVDYMSYNDMSTASIDEVKNSYQKAMEMAKMYFTESSEGSRRFLELLEDTEVEGKKLATNTDGIWNIDIDDIEKAAQAIGVSTEFIQDQMMKLKDKGFEVEFETDTDGLVDYSAELEKVAEKIAVLEKQQSFGDKTEATAEKLKELYAYRDSIEISVETQEVEYAIQRIQELQEQIDSTSNTDAKVGMQQQQQNIIDELNKKTGGNYTVETIVGVDTEDATARFELFKQQVEESGIKSEVVLTPNTSQFDSIKNEIQTNDIVAGVKLEVTDENISTRLSSIIKNAGKKDSGDESESGGIYYKGTVGKAFASGYNGLLKDEKNALRSEYGQPELTVYPNGSYEITNTPTMSDLPKGTVIFNEEQTNRILKGKTHSKGTIGRAFEKGTNATGELNDSGSGKKGGKGSGNDKTEKDSKNLIDWIARRLEVLQTKADRWAKIIENATDAKKITKYYNKLESVYKKQMKTNFDGASRYLSKANSVGLKDSLKKLVQSKDSSLFNKDGNLKSYKELLKKYGEETAEAISNYQDYYDKYQSCIDSYMEACENLYNAPIEEASAKIELLAKSLDVLDAKLDNTSIDNYKDANDLIDKQVANQKDQEKANKSAYNTAKKNLSSAKKSVDSDKDLKKYNDLTKKERDKVLKAVKAGKEIDLTLFKEGSKGYKKALAYNAALQARNDAQQEYQLSVEETKKIEREAEKQKFDNIQEYYEKQVELIQIQEDAIQQEIDLAEARGMTVTSKAYDEQIEKEKQKQAQLQKSKEELTKQLNEIEKGTEEWHEANSALADVNAELTECDITIAEMNHSITELADNFQKKMFKVTSTIRGVMDWLASLMGEYDKFDSKTGAMTKEGLATLGTYVSNYNNSSDDSDKYAKQIAKMEEEYAKYEAIFDPNNPQQYSFVDANNQTRTYNSLEEFKNAIDETYESWRDQISETAKYESQIIDFMRSKYENELGYLKKIIDAKKDELKHEKDLQEYKKSIKSSADSIDSLQKQIMALSNDDSVENQMRLQKLNKELEDSKEELAEKENDRRLSELQDSLDGLYSEYEDLIQSELSDIKGLLEKGIGLAKNFSTEIGSTLTSYAGKYNYNGRFDNVDEGIEKILNPKDDKTETVPKPSENPPDNTPRGKGLIQIDTQEKSLDNITTPPTTVREAMPEKKQEVQVLSVDVTKTEKKATSSTKKSDDDGKIKVGERVKFKSGQYTASSDGSGNKGKQKLGDDVYIQKIVSGAKRPYLIGTKKGGGNLGWVSKSQLSGFSRGGVIEIANLNKQIRENGDDALVSVKEGERILTPLQNQMFEKFINNGLQDLVDASNILQPLVTIPRLPDVQPNTANATQVVQIDNLSLPNVTNYEEFKGKMFNDMQNSKKFETYIRSVSTDRTMGGSRLSKNSIKF